MTLMVPVPPPPPGCGVEVVMKKRRARGRQPKLVEVDLKKANEHECSGIDGKHYFLVQIGYPGERSFLGFGKFSREWYGWNFDGGEFNLQFDAPGFNSSGWKRLWRLEWK